MKKSEIRSRMTDYLEGDLSLSTRALFDAHLDGDEAMAREVAEMREAVHLLRSLEDPEPPLDLAERVMRRLEAGEGKPPLWVRARSTFASGGFGARFAVPALAGSALAIAAVVSGDIELPWAQPVPAQMALHKPLFAPLRAAEPTARPPERPGGGTSRAIADAQGRAAPPRRTVPRALALDTAIESLEARQLAAAVAPQNPSATDRAPLAGAPATRSFNAPIGASAAPELASGSLGARLRDESRPPVPDRVATSSVVPVLPAASDPSRSLAAARALRGPSIDRFEFPLTSPREEGAAADEERDRAELDKRLNLLLADAPAFVRQLTRDSAAARELWMPELAGRALERGIQDQALATLRGSASVEAHEMANAFEAALGGRRSDVIAAEQAPQGGARSEP